MQSENFYVNNLKLSGVVFYPSVKKDKNPTILFVHGWTSAKERSYQYAESLSKLGFLCFLFDMRGHGESEGDRMSLTNEDFLNDVVAAYDFLSKTHGVDKENISVVGSSFGGYLIALLSSKREIKNLVLRAPADYPDKVFEEEKKLSTGNNPDIMEWRKKQKEPRETYALSAINKFQGNVLIIESGLDDRIPHETIENYMNAVKDKSKLTHVIIKGAPHSIKDGKFKDEVEQVLLKWFKDKI
jgi:esterase/lipase